MNKLGIFLIEPEINERYSLMFTKSFPFIKIFGREILWWSIKNILENNKSEQYDIFIYLHKEQKEDIGFMIERISKTNSNLNIQFIFDKKEFDKIKNNYEYKNLICTIGKISENTDLNKMSDLSSFFLKVNYSAERYYYVPDHERQKLFNLYG